MSGGLIFNEYAKILTDVNDSLITSWHTLYAIVILIIPVFVNNTLNDH